jgi:hypothetical protein
MPSPACPYCQRIMVKRHPSLQPTRDHVVPRSQGGRQVVICCLDCNRIKADLLPIAWSAFMLANPEWWRLSRNGIRRRKRLLIVAEDTPPLALPVPIRRAKQGEAPMPPVIVPPGLIWSDISEFVEEGHHGPLGGIADDLESLGVVSNETVLRNFPFDPDDRQDDDHGGSLGA